MTSARPRTFSTMSPHNPNDVEDPSECEVACRRARGATDRCVRVGWIAWTTARSPQELGEVTCIVQTIDSSAVRAATTASPSPVARSSHRSSPVSTSEAIGIANSGPDTPGAGDPLGRISMVVAFAAIVSGPPGVAVVSGFGTTERPASVVVVAAVVEVVVASVVVVAAVTEVVVVGAAVVGPAVVGEVVTATVVVVAPAAEPVVVGAVLLVATLRLVADPDVVWRSVVAGAPTVAGEATDSVVDSLVADEAGSSLDEMAGFAT